MVDSLTSELREVYRSRVLTPTIIETKSSRLSDVAGMVKDYISPGLVSSGKLPSLGAGIQTNLLGRFQSSFSTFKFLPTFNMLAVPLFSDAVEELADAREVERMYLDKEMWAFQYPTVSKGGMYDLPKGDKKITSTYHTKQLMGCDRANKLGFKGKGMKVSVPDTGGRRNTPGVSDRITVKSMMKDKLQVADKNGHGVWCVNCVGGSKTEDRILNIPTEGMAPESELLSLKVLGYVVGTGFTSDIIEGMEYSHKQKADVVSMSLGGKANGPIDEDPRCKVVKELSDKGVTFVVAGGNSGPDSGTIGTPGTCPSALTVGAFNPMNGEIADFSSRGPTPDGDIKPDVVAPGVDTHSPVAGALDKSGDKLTQHYSPLSGTSMATPHTAGLVALMKQAKRKLLNEDMSTEEIKRMMKELGEEKDNISGWGFLNWSKFETWLSTEYDVSLE